MRRRQLLQTDSIYATLFPRSLGSYITEEAVLIFLAMLAFIMALMTLIPIIIGLCRADKEEDEQEESKLGSSQDQSVTHNEIHGLRPVRLLSEHDNDEYRELSEYVKKLASFGWRCLSAATDSEFVLKKVILPTVVQYSQGGCVMHSMLGQGLCVM